MATHFDFQKYGNRRIGLDIGVITEATKSGFDSFIKLFEGTDEVPDYPVKKLSTLNSLKASIVEHVGTMPPSSVVQAQEMLAKAIARQAYETSIGHGYGDGPGWDTLQMLYDQVIASLRNYIASGGTSYVAPGSSTLPTSTTPTPTQAPTGNFLTNTSLFGLPNWLTFGGAAFALYYFTKRKRR